MYQHILIATDGSELANKAVPHGLELAKLAGAKVTALTVRPHLDDFVAEGVVISVSEDELESFKKEIDHHLDFTRAAAKEAGVPLETIQVESGETWKAIVEAARDNKCDLIIMASHGRRGLSALIFGSETQGVLTHSDIPVLVYR
ncbi:MAG: universal stress protein [Alphaproteobacteria bacterium]|nr:universal stress protein [Alphaproteobacteria bacterium]